MRTFWRNGAAVRVARTVACDACGTMIGVMQACNVRIPGRGTVYVCRPAKNRQLCEPRVASA